ncbi:MAG: phage baseplate assembly protein V [Candidatus Azobacteroides sp.]|nr:phage baseplate assembly protein V [Candidatus Azobacteroides sp.]
MDKKLGVKAIASVDGEQVLCKSLKISQTMGEHHDFELLLDHKTIDAGFFNSPDKYLKLAHAKVVCDLQNGNDGGSAYVFSGVVTNVRMIAEDGVHGGVLLIGKSNTIELERGEMMQTYSDTNLKLILEEITGGTLNLDSVIKPAWKADINFAIQCGESDWRFLQRICKQFNERILYTGMDLYIGPYPEFPVVPLKYDMELRSLEIGSRLLPNQFTNYYYKRDEHLMLVQDSPGNIEGATNYLNQISGRSDRLNAGGRKPNVPVAADVPDMGSLKEAVKFKKVATGSRMLYIRGECKTADVKIGRLIDISFPKNMSGGISGLYRVFSVVHELDEAGRYKCLFEAVPADLEHLAMPEVPLPTPYPIEAEVTDNFDPLGLGRVKVKFPFDKKICNAWMPVMSSDAGGNGYGKGPVSRGFCFIPEIRDSVLVSFLNPQQLAQPFVMGSMFHGKNAENLGGGDGNHVKFIRTRSKHLLEFNDDLSGAWGIRIKDDCGNLIHISTKDKSIEITAPENIRISAKNIDLYAKENIRMSAGEDMIESAGKNKTESVGETHVLSAKNQNTFIEQNKRTQVKKNLTADVLKDATLTVDGKINVKGSKLSVNAVNEDVFVKATGKITLKSGDTVDIAQG